MSMPTSFTRGPEVLNRLLAEQTFDLRSLDLAGFRDWLARHLARWETDPVFVQRVRIRHLRRAHPQIRALEKECRRAEQQEAGTPQSMRLQELERELENTGKAIAGLGAAVEGATAALRPPLEEKLTAFQTRRQVLLAEQAELRQASQPWQTLSRVEAELRDLRAAVGLDREEARLEALVREHGRLSGRAGESFEDIARAITRDCIVPELSPGGEGRVLSGVTLGAARTELDQVVVRVREPAAPVEVLGVVEVKRNINDLAHGFRQRQENLAWLSGDTANYDAEAYRTGYFTSGHFDRPATHEEAGGTFVFDRGSFHRFGPTGSPRIDRLYFITRSGPIWGVSSGALTRISHRVATDERWAPESETYLGDLLRWCQSLAEELETPEVLRFYASIGGRQVLLAGSPMPASG